MNKNLKINQFLQFVETPTQKITIITAPIRYVAKNTWDFDQNIEEKGATLQAFGIEPINTKLLVQTLELKKTLQKSFFSK